MATATAERTEEWIPEIERSDLAVRLPVNQQFVKDLELSGSQWRVLVNQLYPEARTVEAVAMALSYCRARNLDIFKRPVHIVRMYSQAANDGKGGMVETVWPGISELRTTAARTGEYAGIDEVIYGPEKTIEFEAEMEKWVKVEGKERKEKRLTKVKKTVTYPQWASVVLYRMVKGVRCPFHAKVFWREAYATIGKTDVPNEMWEERPFGQLDKCVEAAGLRKAFPEEIGNDYAAEEMDGRVLTSTTVATVAETPPKPADKPAEKQQAAAQAKSSDDPPKPSGGQQQRQEPAKQQPAAKQEEKKPDPKPQSSELAGKQVEDADVDFDGDGDEGEETEEEERRNPGSILYGIEEALKEPMTWDELEATWDKLDVKAAFTHFDDADDWIAMAEAMKKRNEKRVKSHGRR